jgi:2'-5' RNA ligase
MRLFLAQRAFIKDLDGLQRQLSPCLKGRWRTTESLHATVLFLGERYTPDSVIETVSQCSFTLEDALIKGIGRFAHNRILYAAALHPTLLQTYHRLSHAFGITHQHNFTPHITLMRYKEIDEHCFDVETAALEGKRLGELAGPLQLMQSTLTPQGAVYETLYRF